MSKVRLNILIVFCVFMMVHTGPVVARTIYVDPNGSADFTGIQAAIDDANNGDEIEVAPGTYYEAINFNGKVVRLYSSGGPPVTIIDANGIAGAYHAVQCVSGEDANTILEGFTITGGNANGPNYPDRDGGGMYNVISSPTVINCIFIGNKANHGGGMLNVDCAPTVTGCTFQNNVASGGTIGGGGMYNHNSSPVITNCAFIGNSGEPWGGGGMFNAGGSNPTLINCTFSGNSAVASGGGMYNWESSPSVKDCNFSGNSTTSEFGGGMFNDSNSSPTVTNCTFSGNSANRGAGMFNDRNSGPTVTNCAFSGNSATLYGGGMFNINNSRPTVTGGCFFENASQFGGGMYNQQSSPTVTNCIFNHNTAYSDGGGLFNYDNSNPTLTNCTFSENTANHGGGMLNIDCTPTVTDCKFSGNSAGQWAGGMYNHNSSPTVTWCTFSSNDASYGGGMCNSEGSNPTLGYCTFSGNSATSYGGGMFNFSNSSPYIYDTAFIDNHASLYGGGMYNSNSSPRLVYCNFTGNGASYNGGGMYNYDNSSPTVYRCNFRNNYAWSYGGGMCNDEYSNPTVTNCIFNHNTADYYGGGMFNADNSNPTLTNCTFIVNSADGKGGGMYNTDDSSPTLTNCTFWVNSAYIGGAFYNEFYSSPTLTNCTLSGNWAAYGGGMYNNWYSNPTVTNCIFWSSTPDEIYNEEMSSATVTYSDVQGGWPGPGNINIYPMLVDAGAGDLRLTWYSPCVDAGDNNAPNLPFTDLADNYRVMDGDGDGTAVVDMGAYELEPGLFKVAAGTLEVTIEPNGAIDAGAKWKVESGEQWYNCGEVVSLPPGYYKLDFNELPDWYEPETLLVGYDTVDSNEVPQQTLWVRVIGDMNVVAIAEYKPLPAFDIGQIPPRDAPHGRTLEFHVDANWLGDDVSYSFTTTFDPNYPEPEGPILIDPVSGLFTYEPNDANDRAAFIVTFRAESSIDVNEQSVRITPIPDLPLEYEILSRPVPDELPLPDPCDRDYIFVNEILSDSNEFLNGGYRQVRSVTVAGIEITIENVFDNPVYVYDSDLDINDLTIFAETLTIRDRLHLPQTAVTIYARHLCFEDRPGSITDINTTPIDLRDIPPDQKTDGLQAGNISLYIESCDGGLNGRFIMNGTKGYYGGSPGDDGVLICTLETAQPLAWLSPYAMKMVVAHARDAYLYRYTAETHDILSEYASLLNIYRALPEYNDVPERWQFEFEQLHQEIITILHRLENGLDYFGNPPDWVPALSFEVLYTVYKQEIDHAIRVMYLSYWLQNKADDISKKAAALSNYRSQLWEDTVQARDNYNIVKDLIGPLKARANSIADIIGTADGECYGLLCNLKKKEAELLERAKRNVHEAHKVPEWKTALNAIGVIGTSMINAGKTGSTAGPEGAAVGVIAGGIVGTISVLTDESIMNPNPWPQASMRTDVAEQFNRINFDQATAGWMDDFSDIKDLSDIEEQGADVYLQNLRGNAADIADGLWDVKEALKTTLLDNEEVEAELKKIKAIDPTFNSLVDAVTELMVEKQVFNRQLAAAMQKVASLSNSMTNNILAIDAMNRDASYLNRIVDPRVVMYVRDMESRALARLRRYHYYLAKAYEYRLLEPYKGDLGIDEMFEKMKKIAAAPNDPETVDGYLGPQDFDALKVIYEDELKQLTEHILTLFLSGRTEMNVPTWFEIYDQQELRQINSGEPLTVNLLEMGLFPSDKENIRIVDMNVAVMNVSLTGDCNGFGQIAVKMQHPAVSKLQYFQQLTPGTENIYQFRHLAEDTKDLLDIHWKSEYNIVTGQLTHPQLSASQESLLWSLLGEDYQEHALIYSRPGAWADITITKRDNLPRPKPDCQPCRGDIEYLLLEVSYDYYDKKAALQTLRVTTWPIIPPWLSVYELMPYFLVDTPDKCGRQDGIGNFYRIYNWYLVPQVKVTAPTTYGNWRFDKWTDKNYDTLGYEPTLEFTFQPEPNDNPTVWAEYVYEGPIPSIADFDLDYDVDFEDYAVLSSVWLTGPADPKWDPMYDISDPPDNYIDWRDVAVFCEDWLTFPQ